MAQPLFYLWDAVVVEVGAELPLTMEAEEAGEAVARW